MDNLSNIDANERSPLESAWEIYADVVFSGSKYRDELRNLRGQSQQGSYEESDRVFKKLEHRERSLKKQFLGLLQHGYFSAYGHDLNAVPSSGESTKIHKSIFDERAEGFQIDWQGNWLKVHHKHFIGIEVAPNLTKLREDYPERFKTLIPTDIGPTPPNQQLKKKMGRPVAHGIENAIDALTASNPQFIHLTRNAQCDRIREHLFGDDVDHVSPPKGYKDGAIKKRLRKKLPS